MKNKRNNLDEKKGMKKMAFKKIGIAPIEDIYCSCGGKVDKETKKCDKCGKEFVPETDS